MIHTRKHFEVTKLKHVQICFVIGNSGVAIPGPTRALARASTYLALASKTDKNHVIIY